jgi:hypothetical protein
MNLSNCDPNGLLPEVPKDCSDKDGSTSIGLRYLAVRSKKDQDIITSTPPNILAFRNRKIYIAGSLRPNLQEWR